MAGRLGKKRQSVHGQTKICIRKSVKIPGEILSDGELFRLKVSVLNVAHIRIYVLLSFFCSLPIRFLSSQVFVKQTALQSLWRTESYDNSNENWGEDVGIRMQTEETVHH